MSKIEVRRQRPPQEVQALIEALYLAQRDALAPPLDNWGTRGGKPAPEVALGFSLDV